MKQVAHLFLLKWSRLDEELPECGGRSGKGLGVLSGTVSQGESMDVLIFTEKSGFGGCASGRLLAITLP